MTTPNRSYFSRFARTDEPGLPVGMIRASSSSWGRWPGPDNTWQYRLGVARVWREFWGQWWIESDKAGDDIGPFGTAREAKAYALELDLV